VVENGSLASDFDEQAEKLWSAGRTGEIVACLDAHDFVSPTNNLKRWKNWHARFESTLGPDHPFTLTARGRIAHWTGKGGNAREALRLFQLLLPDQKKALGPDHRDTLMTRCNMAIWTGETGDARAARGLFDQLLPDQERILGPQDADTLTTRSNAAYWTSRTGKPR